MDTTPGTGAGDAEPEAGTGAAGVPAQADAGWPGVDGPDPHGPDPEESDPEESDVANDPLRFAHWMRRSATGAVLSGIALGLQHALEAKREQPAFVMEAPGEPEDPDAPITLHFDPDDPTNTVAVIRVPRAEPPAGGGNG